VTIDLPPFLLAVVVVLSGLGVLLAARFALRRRRSGAPPATPQPRPERQRRTVWGLAEHGLSVAEIAQRVNLPQDAVHQLLLLQAHITRGRPRGSSFRWRRRRAEDPGDDTEGSKTLWI
jgi:hypothetical protein